MNCKSSITLTNSFLTSLHPVYIFRSIWSFEISGSNLDQLHRGV